MQSDNKGIELPVCYFSKKCNVHAHTGGVMLANGTAIANGNLPWDLKQWTARGRGSPVIRRSFLLSYFKISGVLEPCAPAVYLLML